MAVLTGCDRPSSASSLVQAASTQGLTTRCVGRYLIDLPADLLLTQRGGQNIDDVKLSVVPATFEEYKTALAQRTAALSSATTSAKGVQYPLLRAATPLPGGINGVLFDRAKPQHVGGRMSRVLEVIAVARRL